MSRSVRLVVLLTLALLSAGTAQAHVGSGSGLAPDGRLTRIAAGSHTDFLTVDEAGNVYFGHTDGTTTLAALAERIAQLRDFLIRNFRFQLCVGTPIGFLFQAQIALAGLGGRHSKVKTAPKERLTA